MKISEEIKRSSCCSAISIIVLNVFLTQAALANAPLPGPPSLLPMPLASWSFKDTNFWTSDQGYSPISFTNISWSNMGNGWSLVVDTNGAPALLNYNVYEPTNGATNIVVNSAGSVTFWFGPNWSSGMNGGTGPGQVAQLINVGEVDSAIGYFGVSVDSTGSNVWFAAQDGAGDTYTLSTPFSWVADGFHFVALTYSATNISLYLDGILATNDPGGLSIWPSAAANSVFFGSDTNGNQQAQGMLGAIQTYNFVLDSTNVQAIYDSQVGVYILNPLNVPQANPFTNAPPSLSPGAPSYNEVSGSGFLQLVGSASTCVNGLNADYVWLTNITAQVAANGTMTVNFTIEGGAPGVPYDVFANSILSFGTNGIPWAWMGQAYQCNTYSLTNLPSSTCFLILGTPQDTLGVGLTDAYQLLVTKTDPNNPSAAGDGISNGDKVTMGLNPNVVVPAIPPSFTVQTCPQ